MPTEKKAKTIESLKDSFSRSGGGVLTDYRGLKTAEVVGVRRKLKSAGIEFKVVKNTLASLAAKGAGKEELTKALTGPMAIAFSYADAADAAKILAEYLATSKIGLKITGGFLGNRLLTAKEVVTLATLPPRNVLLARVMSGMQLPLYGLLGQLNAPLRGLMNILQGRIKQLEGAK